MTATMLGPPRIWWGVSLRHVLQYLTVFGSTSWKDAGSGQELIFLIRGIHCDSVPKNLPVARVPVGYWFLLEEVARGTDKDGAVAATSIPTPLNFLL